MRGTVTFEISGFQGPGLTSPLVTRFFTGARARYHTEQRQTRKGPHDIVPSTREPVWRYQRQLTEKFAISLQMKETQAGYYPTFADLDFLFNWLEHLADSRGETDFPVFELKFFFSGRAGGKGYMKELMYNGSIDYRALIPTPFASNTS